MATLDRWGDRIHHVHYKDIRPDIVKDIRENNKSFLDAVIAGAFTVPGDGCIDFQAVSNSLAAMSYSGWIVVEAEQDPAKAPPYDYSKMGYEHIVKVCKMCAEVLRNRWNLHGVDTATVYIVRLSDGL